MNITLDRFLLGVSFLEEKNVYLILKLGNDLVKSVLYAASFKLLSKIQLCNVLFRA